MTSFQREGPGAPVAVADLVHAVRAGGKAGAAAFEELVTRFQDMAMACAYARLSDAELARDVAQEAFMDAYRLIEQLREPAAFPGWFRRIVLKHCDRTTRRRSEQASAEVDDRNEGHREYEHEQGLAASSRTPAALEAPGQLEAREQQAQLRRGLEALSEADRIVVVLHHLAGQSQREIAEVLELSESAVKKRVFDARRRLKQRIDTMLRDELVPLRPSNDANFSRTIRLFLAIRTRDHDEVRRLLEQAPELANATENWSDAEARGGALPLSTKATPLIRAAEADDVGLIDLIVQRGAAVDGDCGCETAESPLWAAVITGRKAAVQRLLELGADPNRATASGHAPLHTAALRGHDEMVHLLVAGGARLDLVDRHGRTAADWAALKGHSALAAALRPVPAKGSAAARAGHGAAMPEDQAEPGPHIITTGIKSLDLFAPMTFGGRIRVQGGQRVGRDILVAELSHNWVRHLAGRAIWAVWQTHEWQRSTLDQLVAEAGIDGLVEVLACPPAVPDHERTAFAEAVARHANEVALSFSGPVLLVLFETEGMQVDPLTALGIASRGVTCIVVAALQDPESAALAELAPPFDSQILFDPELARLAHFPAIHTGCSRGRIDGCEDGTDTDDVARLLRVAARARTLLERVRTDAESIPASDVARAARLRAFLTQPFHTAESFVTRPGVAVPREAMLDGVEAILAGHFDSLPSEALFYRGEAPHTNQP